MDWDVFTIAMSATLGAVAALALVGVAALVLAAVLGPRLGDDEYPERHDD